MAFPLKDVRFTSRRTGDGAPLLYPRLMRDRSVLPKIDIAAQYFESMLGAERRELDPEVLVHFFADHKLARCMVACLARSYRYRARELGEIVTRASLRRLRRAGVDSPKALRLLLYDRVNEWGDGFLRASEREATVGRIEAELGLRGGELERLLYLDAEEHQILTRVGAEPRPEDVVAQYNFGILETMLRHAEYVDLHVAAWQSGTRAAVLALGSSNGVDAELTPVGGLVRVRLLGRQDALGVWTRHGRKVARTVVQLLERARPTVVDGEAGVAFRDRRGRLRLTPEVLDILGGTGEPRAAGAGIGWHELDGWGPADLGRAVAAPRGRWEAVRLRRAPDAQAWAAGVVVPDLLVGVERRRALVCAVRSAAHGARLAPIAPAATTGDPLVFVGDGTALGALEAVGARVLAAERFDLGTIVAALPDLLGPADDSQPFPRVA